LPGIVHEDKVCANALRGPNNHYVDT
jgi:hypothetical protein